MQKTIKILCVFAVLIALTLTSSAEAKQRRKAKVRHHKVHHAALVDRSASYADIVIEADTGRILHATNPDSLRHPASLTKMMTLYLAFQALESGRLRLTDYLAVSSNAAAQSPSKLGLRPGQRIRVEDAILGLVTESANDAAVVIAEGLGGSENAFGNMMTRQARALGMSKSNFENPSGLPNPDQVTTARDMAVLGHALIYHFPQFYPYFSRSDFSYAGINHRNHNHLMERYDGMDGIKTGYIRASGFNLVASAKRNGTRLIGVVFGGRSAVTRDSQMEDLLDQAFDSLNNDNGASPIRTVDMRPAQVSQVAQIAQGDAADTGYARPLANPVAASVASPVPPVSQNFATPVAPQPAVKTVPKPVQNIRVAAANPAPAMAAPVAVRAASGNKWGIQIGAYGDPEIGRQALAAAAAQLPQLLGDADPIIQKVASGTITLFRARLVSLDQRSAQTACVYLNQHGQSCMVVSP